MNELQKKVKENPILMNGDMVRAILSGQKTQTRRPVKLNDSGRPSLGGKNWHIDDPNCVKACPFGQIGDRLWVRETWSCISSKVRPGACVAYRADTTDGEKVRCDAQWRPSIHMSRWASRITLEITGVRVEGIADISEEDAVNEGIQNNMDGKLWCGAPHKIQGRKRMHNTAKEAFFDLWDFFYQDSRSVWDPNPSVWVIEFRRVEG